jgi:hypothetical protein
MSHMPALRTYSRTTAAFFWHKEKRTAGICQMRCHVDRYSYITQGGNGSNLHCKSYTSPGFCRNRPAGGPRHDTGSWELALARGTAEGPTKAQLN